MDFRLFPEFPIWLKQVAPCEAAPGIPLSPKVLLLLSLQHPPVVIVVLHSSLSTAHPSFSSASPRDHHTSMHPSRPIIHLSLLPLAAAFVSQCCYIYGSTVQYTRHDFIQTATTACTSNLGPPTAYFTCCLGGGPQGLWKGLCGNTFGGNAASGASDSGLRYECKEHYTFQTDKCV